jgi:hypothetical protein
MVKLPGRKIGSIAGAVVALAVMATQSFSTTISINPASSTIGFESIGSVDVAISDLAGVGVGAYDVTINYDPLVLEFDSFKFSTELGIQEVDAFGIVTPGAGSVNLYNFSFADLSGQPDDFALGTLYFKGIQMGATSELSITVNELGDANGDAITGATVINGSATVPEPSATMLFITGLVCLIGLGGIRRKSDQKQ